ncbi:hypothetical protein [Sphingomonas yantingensis]|uniref:Uncharacterized protein n=1 Tax=Sphingomonas yantingensis TaxID=1241761 RepID=A0A7W9EJA7_9SPHN|nr:hypothetical protein [Sphingomonas yantingensis]MBB5700032.1 hypothetical protein [Sphingomonas yantingensis]
MITKQQVAKAKEAFDLAWGEAVKCSEEVQHALDMAEMTHARDASDTFVKKAKRALEAHDNWCRAAQNASKLLQGYFEQSQPK